MRIHVRLFAALVLALVVSGACKNPSGPSPTPTPTPPPPAVRSVTVVYSGPVPSYTLEPEISPSVDLGRPGASGQFIGFVACVKRFDSVPTVVPIKFKGPGNVWECTFLLNEGEEVWLRAHDTARGKAEGSSSLFTSAFQFTNASVTGGPFIDTSTGLPFLKIKVH